MKCADETLIFFLDEYNTFTMISMSLERIFLIAAFSFLNIDLCVCACGRAEYEINGECCPMCPPGKRVYTHCTEFTRTTCMPCVDSTYTDEPNGFLTCLGCTVCDVGKGLKVKNACTWTSDTVCEPLEGFYCTDDYRDKCTFALQHTKCNPGEYIKQEGTAVKDTECSLCADGTYSNGSLHICKQHTKCEDLGHEEITPGNNSVDAQCGVKTPTGHIIFGVTAVLAVVLAVGVAIFFKQIKKKAPHKDNPAHMTPLSDENT